MSFPVLGRFYQRLLFLLPFASEPFNYDDPNQWPWTYPQCNGIQQSPIAISTHKAHPVHNLPPILFGLYDVFLDDTLQVHNNGHTIKFDVPVTIAGEKPFITGGLLADIYEAEEVHFHWGSPQHKGTEHKLNGKRYDLEMHIVHRNVKFPSVKAARDYDDGLAVLAVLFKVVKSPNVLYPGLNDLYSAMERLVEFNSSVTMRQIITLDSLLGTIDRDDFYTYRGSLTTPPCSESVTWHVFSELVPISYLELPKFWNMLDSRGHLLRNNYRPLQSIEYRKVFHRKPFKSNWRFFEHNGLGD